MEYSMSRILWSGVAGAVSSVIVYVILIGVTSSSVSEFGQTVEQQVADHWPEFLLVLGGAFGVGILAARLRLSQLLLFVAIFMGEILGGVAIVWIWILTGEDVSARGFVAVAITATSVVTLLVLHFGATLLRKRTGEAK